MSKCTKCGTELCKAIFIKSIKAGSVSEKLFVIGDAIIAINENPIKEQSDIKKIGIENKFFKITILHSDKTITTSAILPAIYLNDVNFEEISVCLKCGTNQSGTKQKRNKLPILIGIIVALIILLIVIFLNKNTGKQINQEIITENTDNIISNEQNDTIEKEVYNIIPEKTLNTLEKTLKENVYNNNEDEKSFESNETQERKRSGSNRSEVFVAYDESGKILNLRDTYFGTIDLNDGITFSTDSRNQIGESSNSETKIRSRRVTNRTENDLDSIENTLNTITELKDTIIEMADISDISEKVIGRIYFDYGSSLEPANMNLSIEKYLLIQKQSEELKQYSSIVLGLNDLLNKIPEDKRDSAVFILMGYADSTLFNAEPEISERSNKYNTELSLKRAKTVETILESSDFGISSNKIVTQGLGYSKNEQAVNDLWKYRRVDVVVSYE